MRISGTWNPEALTQDMIEAGQNAVIAAYEAGYTLFDHADIYGRGTCETIFGRVLKRVQGMRERIVIATKCGVRFGGDPNPDSPGRYDFSREHILRSCDKSLERMGIETIDIYQLHRPDPLMNPDEVAEAFEELHAKGKVRYFGVSNFVPSFYSALQKALRFPLVVNQVEISLAHLDCFNDGTLDQCLQKLVLPLSWSPLGGGFLGDGGTVPTDHPQKAGLEKLLKLLDKTAEDHGVTRTAIALAWLIMHPANIVPIVGTSNPDRIKIATEADNVDLSREEWYRLFIAARMAPMP